MAGSKITVDGDCSHEIRRHLLLRRKANLDSKPRWRTYYFDSKGPYSQRYGFSSSDEWIWELDPTEGWALENWCFPTVVLEMILDSPLASKEMQPVHPKGDHSWIFIVSTDGDTEAPILWSHDARRQLIGKDPDAGKDRRQGERGTTEDAMVGWHHQLNGHEFEQASGVGEGQGSWHAAVQGVTKSQLWLGDWINNEVT